MQDRQIFMQLSKVIFWFEESILMVFTSRLL